MDPSSGQPAPSRIKLWKVSHVVLRVADLERSLVFYSDTLGMVMRSRLPGAAHMDGGGVTLTLLQPPPGAASAVALGGASEIVFETHDVRAAHAWLRSRGAPFTGGLRAVVTDKGRDLLAGSFRDPDGHMLCITGWCASRAPAPGARHEITASDLTKR